MTIREVLDRVTPWLPWIKRAVFLLVLIGLLGAASKAVQRWQRETEALSAEVADLSQRARTSVDPDTAATLRQQAQQRFTSLPALANVRWSRVLASAVLYGFGLLLPGWVLHRCLMALETPCTRRRAIAAQLLGHAGKYIPGKAMVVVLRAGAILPQPLTHTTSAAGVDIREPSSSPRSLGRVTSCIFFETLLMMGVGGAFAGVLLWQSPLPVWVRSLAALMAIGCVVPLCPPILRRLIELIAQRREQKQSPADDHGRLNPAAITWALLAECWLVSLLSWVLIGLSFAMLITAIPAFERLPPLRELTPVATAAISLGMVLGFASLLPGGAGVREYVTLLVLAPVIGQTHALLAVIAARLLFIVVESFLAGMSLVYLRRLRSLSPILPG